MPGSTNCLVVRRVGNLSYRLRAQIYLFVRRVGSLFYKSYTGKFHQSEGG